MIKSNTPYACMNKLINIIEINLRGAHGAPYNQGCNLNVQIVFWSNIYLVVVWLQ